MTTPFAEPRRMGGAVEAVDRGKELRRVTLEGSPRPGVGHVGNELGQRAGDVAVGARSPGGIVSRVLGFVGAVVDREQVGFEGDGNRGEDEREDDHRPPDGGTVKATPRVLRPRAHPNAPELARVAMAVRIDAQTRAIAPISATF
jgi:hypothetical protein